MSKLNSQNPFLSLVYDIKTRTRPSFYAKGDTVAVIDECTGEVRGRGYNAVLHEKRIDTERFLKVYAKGRQVLPKLSTSATKVLWFLLDGMGYDDVVTLNMDKVKKATGYTNDAVIYRALSELRKYEILANAYRNGLYFVNPTMFYRGNRVKLINDNS